MSRATRPPRASDPYGVGPVRGLIAPVAAVVGLLVVAFFTLGLLNGQIPLVGAPGGAPAGSGGAVPGVTRTAAPSNVVVVEPEAAFPGSIVYAKAGNIWVQSGKDVRQLTTAGTDSMPSWSPDGEQVYFIRTAEEIGQWPSQGRPRRYLMDIPSVMVVKADGSAAPTRVINGKIRKGSLEWFTWLRQPVPSPDGKTLALVSDQPDPTRSDVVLQTYDLGRKRWTIPDISEIAPLGHQDPAWKPDGSILAYVRNGRDGPKGAAAIYRYDIKAKKATPLTGPGYLEPNYSPDGRYIAATKSGTFGSDVVVIDAVRGRELLRVTTDGGSWGPVWSPKGDAIAFLHIEGQIVDLRMAVLGGKAPDWTVTDTKALTEVSGLDGASRPDWHIPASELPAPTPAPTPSATASPAVSASAPAP
jgi:dipeptidyl aminopeptidase/acylaminoacyl peptidase